MNPNLAEDEDFIHNEKMRMSGDTAVLDILPGPRQRVLLVRKIKLQLCGTLDFFKGHLNLCQSHGNQCRD